MAVSYDQKLKVKITEEIKRTPLQQLQAEMKAVAAAQQTLHINGQQNSKTFVDNQTKLNSLKNTLKEFQGISKGFSGAQPLSGFRLASLGADLTIIGAGLKYVNQQVLQFGKYLYDAALKGAEFGVLLDSFKSIGGTDADLKLLGLAAAGNLSKRELIALATQFDVLDLSIQQTTLLLDAIEVQADKTSKTFADGTESVKKFIATGSGRGLVGFMNINALKDEVDRLNNSLGVSADELTDVQKEMNRAQAVINLYGNASADLSQKIKDNADKIATLKTAFVDFIDDFNYGLSEGILKNEDFLKSFDGLEETGQLWGEVLGGMANDVLNFAAKVASATKDVANYLVDLIADKDVPYVAFGKEVTKEEFEKIKADQKRVQDRIDKNVADDLRSQRGSDIAPKTSRSKTGGKEKTVKEITNDVIDLQRQIENLQAKLNITTQGTVLFAKYESQINTLKNSIELLNTPLENFLKLTGKIATVEGSEGFKISEIPIDKELEEFKKQIAEQEGLKEASEKFSENISNSFSLGLDLSNQIADVLGNAPMSKALSDLQRGIQLANTIALILQASGILGGGGGIFGFIGGLFGGGGGGGASRSGFSSGFIGGRSSIQVGGSISVGGETRIRGNDIVQSYNRTTNDINILID